MPTIQQINAAERMLSRMARAARCFPQSAADTADIATLESMVAEIRHVANCWDQLRGIETAGGEPLGDSRAELTERLLAACLPVRAP